MKRNFHAPFWSRGGGSDAPADCNNTLVTAVDQKDQASLRQLRPHVQTMTGAALPAADEDTIGGIRLITGLRRQLAQTA